MANNIIYILDHIAQNLHLNAIFFNNIAAFHQKFVHGNIKI
jgi:hypothetical protein